MLTIEKTGQIISHGDHLTEEEKSKDGVTYTYNWGLVTNPAHLKARNSSTGKNEDLPEKAPIILDAPKDGRVK